MNRIASTALIAFARQCSYVARWLVELPHPGDAWNDYDFAADLSQLNIRQTGIASGSSRRKGIREDFSRSRAVGEAAPDSRLEIHAPGIT